MKNALFVVAIMVTLALSACKQETLYPIILYYQGPTSETEQVYTNSGAITSATAITNLKASDLYKERLDDIFSNVTLHSASKATLTLQTDTIQSQSWYDNIDYTENSGTYTFMVNQSGLNLPITAIGSNSQLSMQYNVYQIKSGSATSTVAGPATESPSTIANGLSAGDTLAIITYSLVYR